MSATDTGFGIFTQGMSEAGIAAAKARAAADEAASAAALAAANANPADKANAAQAELNAKAAYNRQAGLAVYINLDWLALQTGPSADALRAIVAAQTGLPHILP